MVTRNVRPCDSECRIWLFCVLRCVSLLLPNSSRDLESTCDGNSTVSHLKGEQGDSSCSAAHRDRPLRSPSLCSTKMPSVAHLSSPLSSVATWLVLHGCCADLCDSRDQFFLELFERGSSFSFHAPQRHDASPRCHGGHCAEVSHSSSLSRLALCQYSWFQCVFMSCHALGISATG